MATPRLMACHWIREPVSRQGSAYPFAGIGHSSKWRPESGEEAPPSHQRGSSFGAAHAGLGLAMWRQSKGYSMRGSRIAVEAQIRQLATRALSFGQETLAHVLLSKIHLFDKNEHGRAEEEARKAVQIDPNSSEALVTLATVLLYSGRIESAVETVKRAMRLNPSFPYTYQILLAQAEFENKQYRTAINRLGTACENVVDFFYWRPCGLYSASAHGYLKELERGRKQLRPLVMWSSLSLEKNFNGIKTIVALRLPFKNKSSQDHLLKGIKNVVIGN